MMRSDNMSLMPLMIDMQNKHVVIIGGGKVAERRVHKFIDFTSHIRIISPELTPNLNELYQDSVIEWIQKKFESSEDIAQADLIIVATNDEATNQHILKVKPPHALINMAGEASQGNVIVPNILRRGHLTISITTNGASPGLTSQLLSEFEQRFPTSYESYVDFLYECRTKVKNSSLSSTEKQNILKALLDETYLDTKKQKEIKIWLDSIN